MHRFFSNVILKITELATISQALSETLGVKEEDFSKALVPYLLHLRNDIFIYIEYPYSDNFYQDISSVNFSAKQNQNSQCMRLAFFATEITQDDFRDLSQFTKLQQSFMGFTILRPTLPHIIGTSIINHKALRMSDFNYCKVSVDILINGIELRVTGFPHCAQEDQMNSCAITTIWSVMEYFSYKERGYIPVLPFQILKALSPDLNEVQLRLEGAQASQIVDALQRFGLKVGVYSRNVYQDLGRILSHYIDSNIPVIVILLNESNTEGRAVIYIGSEQVQRSIVDNYLRSLADKSEKLTIINFADIEKRYIVIDELYPPYQLAHFHYPTEYYRDPRFRGWQIASLIVPLNQKIDVDAACAYDLVVTILSNENIGWKNSGEIIVRLFLTSSRLYKYWVTSNTTINEGLKEIIISMLMPEYVWVAELAEEGAFIRGKTNGIILINTTDCDCNIFEQLILCAYPDRMLIPSLDKANSMSILHVPNTAFDTYNPDWKPIKDTDIAIVNQIESMIATNGGSVIRGDLNVHRDFIGRDKIEINIHLYPPNQT